MAKSTEKRTGILYFDLRIYPAIQISLKCVKAPKSLQPIVYLIHKQRFTIPVPVHALEKKN
jgi:hypothetical protein